MLNGTHAMQCVLRGATRRRYAHARRVQVVTHIDRHCQEMNKSNLWMYAKWQRGAGWINHSMGTFGCPFGVTNEMYMQVAKWLDAETFAPSSRRCVLAIILELHAICVTLMIYTLDDSAHTVMTWRNTICFCSISWPVVECNGTTTHHRRHRSRHWRVYKTSKINVVYEVYWPLRCALTHTIREIGRMMTETNCIAHAQASIVALLTKWNQTESETHWIKIAFHS